MIDPPDSYNQCERPEDKGTECFFVLFECSDIVSKGLCYVHFTNRVPDRVSSGRLPINYNSSRECEH